MKSWPESLALLQSNHYYNLSKEIIDPTCERGKYGRAI